MGRPPVLRPQLRRDSLGGGWRTSPKGSRGVVAAELERPARMTMARGGYPEATPPQPHRRRPGFRGCSATLADRRLTGAWSWRAPRD